eukprot:3597565-Rhodomonas_salina.1
MEWEGTERMAWEGTRATSWTTLEGESMTAGPASAAWLAGVDCCALPNGLSSIEQADGMSGGSAAAASCSTPKS